MNVKTNGLIILVMLTQAVFAQADKGRVIPIDTLFALVERNSTQLKISASDVERAQQAIAVEKNSHLPSVDVGLSALYLGNATLLDRNFTNVQSAAMPHFGNNFSVEASYLVFSGGAVSNSIEKARLDAKVAQLAHQRNRSDMRFLVTGYYLDLYKLQNQRKVFRENIEETEMLIRQITAKQKEGMALGNDITRYELMLQNLKLALIEIDNNINIINRQLVVTLGLPAEIHILADTTIQNLQLMPSSEEELMRMAETNRPELQTAALHNAIAESVVKLARSKYYPSVAVIAANEFNGPITIEVPPINKNLNYWYLGVGVKYNLASLYKSNKEVRVAKTNQNRARYAQLAELENAQTTVYAAQTRFKESFEKLHTYEKNFQLASENYAIINNRYMNGLVLITEMLDASNTKLNAELEVTNARLNTLYNYYKLLREIGKL